MPNQQSGFRELPHTADWALQVWAPDLAGLFVEAARGMNALTSAAPGRSPTTTRTFEATASDPESLLVAFLSELVYAAESQRLLFAGFEVQLSEAAHGWSLRVEMQGAPLVSASKTIKAVTYHNLHVRKTRRGFEVEIVFDV
jgi:SHS2 domain-containing protein